MDDEGKGVDIDGKVVALAAVDGGVEEDEDDDGEDDSDDDNVDDESNVESNSKNWGKVKTAATKAESCVSLTLFLGVQKTLARNGWTTMK